MKRNWSEQANGYLETIIVPSASGSIVLRIWMGMPLERIGRMASSWSTDAPM